MASDEESEEEEIKAVVMDLGGWMIKAGFDDENVRSVDDCIVGTLKPQFKPFMMKGIQNKEYFCGRSAESRRGILNLVRPIQRGQIADLEKLMMLFEHTLLNELRVETSVPLMVAVSPTMSPEQSHPREACHS